MKAISPYVATVILVIASLSIGLLIVGWFRSYVSSISSETTEKQTSLLECQYGSILVYTESIVCENGYLNFSLRNNGQINLYDIRVNVFSGKRIYSFELLEQDTNNKFTKDNPLMPGEVKNVYVNVNVSNITIEWIEWFEVTTQCNNVNSGKIYYTC